MPLPKNFTFYISGRHELKYLADKKINYFIGFNHPVQIEEERYSYENVSSILGEIEYFNTHEVHDVWTQEHKNTGYKMPDEKLIVEIINSAIVIMELLSRGEKINLLCACQAGKSRSTAACYIILCYLLGEWNEREALNLIENKRSIARPNVLMVKLADDLLKRRYKMLAPLKNHLDLGEENDDSCLLW
jgi:predicted protein tyrosine phosphatase